MTGGGPTGAATTRDEDLPTYLRRAMRDAGFATITAFADAVEMDTSQMNKILNGRTRPGVETLLRLAKALKRPPSEVARAGGYAVEDPPERRVEDPTLVELMLLLQEDEDFMADFAQAKPLDGDALRDMAQLLRPYLAAMRRARLARARPRRDAGGGDGPASPGPAARSTGVP